jgi:phosphatidylserine decarboxylase
MSGKQPIMIFNRASGRMEPEVVMGEGGVRFLYESALGRVLGSILFKRRLFSRFMGRIQDTRSSARKIRETAARLSIDLEECEKAPEDYESFNAFFTRRLKEGARPVDASPEAVISPCDARMLALPRVDAGTDLVVKGSRFRLETLLSDARLAARYEGGSLLIYRLCPADYHRFHFPESGLPGPVRILNGPLHSVNPIALGTGLRILESNLRHCTGIETGNGTGAICMVEIGAMCVGSIVQTFEPGAAVERGAEKGMFRFGGSTVVVIYEAGRMRVDEDILHHSREGVETLVRMGTSVGAYR